MAVQCMKCGYVRKETDAAALTECPKCGAIYAKVAASRVDVRGLDDTPRARPSAHETRPGLMPSSPERAAKPQSDETTTALSNLERKVFFSLTRGFALVVLVLQSIALVGATGYLLFAGQGGFSSSSVAPSEVIDALRPMGLKDPQAGGAVPSPAETKLLAGRKLSFVLQKHFSSPGNMRTLERWLAELSEPEQQAFLNELSNAVAEGESQRLDIEAVVSKFRELKTERARQAEKQREQVRDRRLYAATVAGGSLALIALFSLILVLLAIERNTRRAARV